MIDTNCAEIVVTAACTGELFCAHLETTFRRVVQYIVDGSRTNRKMSMTPTLKSARPGASMRAVGCCARPRAQAQPLNAIVRSTVASVGAAIMLAATPAFADLNKFEAATGGSVAFILDCHNSARRYVQSGTRL